MSETYELTTKTRQNAAVVISKRRDEILKMSADNIRKMGPAFFLRAITTVTSNPDTDRLMTTAKGMDTWVKAVTDAAMVGISFGGPKPQAYFVPKDGGILMIPTASGIRHAVCYGVGAVLRTVPELVTVREGDNIRVDPAKGTFSYESGGFDPFAKERGTIRGWVMRLQFKDGRPDQVRYVDTEKVHKIQAQYSMTGGPAYKKSPEEMDEKTASKYLLRDVFAESAGLAQMLLEGDAYQDEPEPISQPRDAGERLSRVVTGAAQRLDPDKASEPVEPEPEEGPEQAEQAETEQEDGDLFK